MVSRMATLHRVPRLLERHMCIRYDDSTAFSCSVVVHCMKRCAQIFSAHLYTSRDYGFMHNVEKQNKTEDNNQHVADQGLNIV